MSFSRALLIVFILDIIVGCVVFWPFCEHRDALTDLYLMVASFVVNIFWGAVFGLIPKTRMIGNALLCNSLIAAPLTLELSKLSYTMWNEKVYGDDVSYFFYHNDHRYQIDLHGDKYMRYMSECFLKAGDGHVCKNPELQYCIFRRSEDCSYGVICGTYSKDSDNSIVMLVDSTCSYLSCDSIPVVSKTLVFKNDSLYGLFPDPVRLRTE
ncbi:MAG: hypothetical protein MJZ15_02630 [Bacteroidales bacterium]|nr:hypothetical protein [Bacteroidales bacterium]